MEKSDEEHVETVQLDPPASGLLPRLGQAGLARPLLLSLLPGQPNPGSAFNRAPGCS